MTLLQLLVKAAGATGDLRALLEAVGDAAPDLKPQADEWLALLGQAVSAEGLAAVVLALPAELAEIARGKLSPREHPGDAI